MEAGSGSSKIKLTLPASMIQVNMFMLAFVKSMSTRSLVSDTEQNWGQVQMALNSAVQAQHCTAMNQEERKAPSTPVQPSMHPCTAVLSTQPSESQSLRPSRRKQDVPRAARASLSSITATTVVAAGGPQSRRSTLQLLHRALMRASRRESLMGSRANPFCRLPAFDVEIH